MPEGNLTLLLGAMVPVLFGIMGVGSGIAGPSRDLLVKQATPPGATGRVYGVVYSGLDVGMTIAPLIFGALMDAGGYREVWIGVALAQVLLIATAFNVKRNWRAAPALQSVQSATLAAHTLAAPNFYADDLFLPFASRRYCNTY